MLGKVFFGKLHSQACSTVIDRHMLRVQSFTVLEPREHCHTEVMESASSRMMSLNGGQGYPATELPTAPAAKPLILLRTTPMPRSSLALSSMTRVLTSSGLHAGHDQQLAQHRRLNMLFDSLPQHPECKVALSDTEWVQRIQHHVNGNHSAVMHGAKLHASSLIRARRSLEVTRTAGVQLLGQQTSCQSLGAHRTASVATAAQNSW